MKTMTKMMLAATVAISGILAATAANAALVINISQVGLDVVVAGSGRINTAGLTNYGAGPSPTGVGGAYGLAVVGINGGYSDGYGYAFTNPGTFGTGDGTIADSGNGSNFGLIGGSDYNAIYLPINYISGTALSGTSLFNNTTLASLGLTIGSYVFNVSNGDTVTVNIGPVAAAVPETATWAMMIAGFGMMGAAMRTRRRSTKVTFA